MLVAVVEMLAALPEEMQEMPTAAPPATMTSTPTAPAAEAEHVTATALPAPVPMVERMPVPAALPMSTATATAPVVQENVAPGTETLDVLTTRPVWSAPLTMVSA